MNSFAILLLGLMIAGQAVPAGKVDTTFDKKANFAALRTYSWAPGKDAFLPEAHRMIISACDTEMAALGFKKVDSGADVTISYYTMTLTQVDLKALDKIENTDRSAPAPTKELGKLVVVMRNQAREQLWTATTNEFLDSDRARLAATIQTVTARLFATYPTRANRK
jgi:hypothetical protein